MQASLRTRQSGQIAPVASFGVLIAGAVLVTMFNTGQKITEKSQVANAADAAAYSGAVWTARHLNFMAYTNRAMVANHAAVGHLVSYVAWIRYVDDSIEYIDRITQFIPYVGQYVGVVEQLAQSLRDATQRAAAIAVPAVDGWNANLRAAQMEVQASLALDHLNDLMQQTAQRWDPAIRVNDRDAIGKLPHEIRAVVESQLIGQLVRVPTFVERFAAGSDHGAIGELIDASVRANNDMRRWIAGERGWRENLLLAQIRKQGGTGHSQTAAGADWRATDQLQHRTRSLFGWHRWRRIGDRPSSASASEFDSSYAGVPHYYNVAGSPGDRSLRIAALAIKPQPQVQTRSQLGLATEASTLAVAAMAKVEFTRPDDGSFARLGVDRHEYANLFNPFWEARLAPLEPLGR